VTAPYRVPAGEHRARDEISRSRFVTTLAPAPSLAEAHAFVARVRAEFPDATHNCWAFVVGPPGSTGRVGLSDAGEPHGTAGRPMLTALLHSGVGDVAAVVTRYYGGTKLGTGGPGARLRRLRRRRARHPPDGRARDLGAPPRRRRVRRRRRHAAARRGARRPDRRRGVRGQRRLRASNSPRPRPTRSSVRSATPHAAARTSTRPTRRPTTLPADAATRRGGRA
jgi:hypothetical protein